MGGTSDVDTSTGNPGRGLEPVLRGDEEQPGHDSAPGGGLSFVGTVDGDAGTPLQGEKVRFTVDGENVTLTDREENLLGSWALLHPPIPHRAGYYFRTADHGLVFAKWCQECNGDVNGY